MAAPTEWTSTLPAETADDAKALLAATLKSAMGGESLVLVGPAGCGKSALVSQVVSLDPRSCAVLGTSAATDEAAVFSAFAGATPRRAWVWFDLQSSSALRHIASAYAKVTAAAASRPQLLLTTVLVPDAETLALLHAAKVRVVALPNLISKS